MLKSPISRMGGKKFLCNWIVEKIPEHEIFVEAFAGSCVVSLNKRQCSTTIVNDLDQHLISFWKVLQDSLKRQELISYLNTLLYSRAEWREMRDKWKVGDIPVNPIERAGQWFFLARSCYASDMQHGGFIGYTQGRNMCKTFRNVVGQLNEVGELVKTWIVENLDYKTCITRFDSPSTAFYVDSPYYLPGKREYYQNSFTLDDHVALAKLLTQVRQTCRKKGEK